jgi:NADH-quinone oxidoreductase subunit C
MSAKVVDALKATFGAAVLENHARCGDDTVVVEASKWLEVATFLKNDPAMKFDMLSDLCAVDYPDRLPRFEVVIHLYSISLGHRIRVKARVGDEEGDGAEIATVTELWPGANWFERETYDMNGIVFQGHPDLRRILLYPEFEGFPLRKDYPAARTQPLVAYRTEAEAGLPLEKLAPFREDEGMAFGRRELPTSEPS